MEMTQTLIERLTKIYADCPEEYRGIHGARDGYEWNDRELYAIVGPMSLDEALAACDAMPRGYNAFTREGLRAALFRLAAEGAQFFSFAREASVCIYIAPCLPGATVRGIFSEANEIDCEDGKTRVWWD